jgi:uncharacterized membrane protein
MIRKKLIKNKTNFDMVRWRLHEPARIEAFSDAVMALAVTLLVVSLEVPKTYDELFLSLRGVFGFAICFLMLMLVWHDQYLFFRRYGLQDTRTISYNSMLMFVLLMYVYPLKFLFTYLTQGNDVMVNGKLIHRFTEMGQMGKLMIVYSTGYFIINLLFVLMHKHALKEKHELELLPIERFNTDTFIYVYYGVMGVGILSIILALLGIFTKDGTGILESFSGMIYGLVGIVISQVHSRRNKMLEQRFTKNEMEELKQHIQMEE